MNPTDKKFLSLFLVFTLLTINCATLRTKFSKKRQGAKLIVTEKNGQQVKGELITVKPNSLLLLDTEGKDVSIDIADIEVIRVKKPGASLGAGIGGAIGFGVGLYVPISRLSSAYKAEDGDGGLISYLLLGILVVPVAMVVGAIVGVAIGWGVGALVKGDDVIYLTGMTDSEIQETLDKLRKKARVRDYK